MRATRYFWNDSFIRTHLGFFYYSRSENAANYAFMDKFLIELKLAAGKKGCQLDAGPGTTWRSIDTAVR